jgi:hypothetical protein
MRFRDLRENGNLALPGRQAEAGYRRPSDPRAAGRYHGGDPRPRPQTGMRQAHAHDGYFLFWVPRDRAEKEAHPFDSACLSANKPGTSLAAVSDVKLSVG